MNREEHAGLGMGDAQVRLHGGQQGRQDDAAGEVQKEDHRHQQHRGSLAAEGVVGGGVREAYCSASVLEHGLVAQAHDLADGAALADLRGHQALPVGYLLGRFQHFRFLLARNEHHAAAVGDDEVSGVHLDAGELDLLVAGLLQDASPRGHGRRAPGVDGKAQLVAFVHVAAGAVHDDASDALQLGRQRQQPAPGGDRPSGVVDDDDVAVLRSLDGAGAQVLLRLVQPRGLKLHGHGAAADPRARPERADAGGGAAQAETIQGVGYGAGIEAGKAFDDISFTGHGLSCCLEPEVVRSSRRSPSRSPCPPGSGILARSPPASSPWTPRRRPGPPS